MYRVVCAVIALVAAVCSALPTPLSGSAEDRLYGDDCSEWCFNGTDVLQPEVFGSSTAHCPDSRGCEWKWHLSVAPCSLSLLAFDAMVGPDETPFSAIDPAVAGSLQFYCSESDGGVVLELRPHAGAPIMAWHYRSVTCVELLGDFAARQADFTAHEVSVLLENNDWFASGSSRLEDEEIECRDDAVLLDDMEPCRQCFRGLEEPALPADGWGDVCGERATTCQVGWRFCYDVCAGTTSHVSVTVGAEKLRDATDIAKLEVQCAESRGRTVLALTDAETIGALDAGQARFYLAWEYRDVECEALMRSPRRHTLFVERHFGVERPEHTGEDGTLVEASMLAMLNVRTGGLDERVWIGTGSEQGVSAEGSSDLSSLEIGLIVGLAVAGGLLILSCLLNLLLWRRGTSGNDGISFSSLVPIPARVEHEMVPAGQMWGDGSSLVPNAVTQEEDEVEDRSVDIRRDQLKQTIARVDAEQNDQLKYLANPDEHRAGNARRDAQRAAAQRELDAIDGQK